MLHNLTLKQAHEGLKSKQFSCEELTKDILKRAKDLNPKLNAYITITQDQALKTAKELDVKGDFENPLTGVSCGLKDIFNTKGVKTTCASPILKDFVPPYDATVVSKLRKVGAVFAGKTNLDEFACGGSTEHSCFGVTKNPWDFSCVAGGSSGGSAAAVAADLCSYALGTDTGGSIRLPASFCGVVGLKVTYGRVSRSGITALASSLDTIGPFTKTVEDAAIVLKEMAGKDQRDATTSPLEVPDYLKSLGKSVKGLKIGVPKEYFGDGIDKEVQKLVKAALSEYEKMGAIIKEVSLPYTKYAVAIYYIAMPAELSANLARFDGIRFGSGSNDSENVIDYYYKSRDKGFGDEIKRRIMVGTYVLSAGYYDAYYKKAQKVRTLVIQDFERAFEQVDVLMAPVCPVPAFKIGEKADDPLAMYLVDALNIPANCAGIPALSLPCGFTSAGLPVGLQIIAPQFGEDLLFKVGSAYEQVTEWHKVRPKL